MATRGEASVGIHGMWGFSPALNLLSSPVTSKSSTLPPPPPPSNPSEPINILLLQSCDIRHVLRTLSCRLRDTRSPRPLHFYVFDNPCECVARHLLLLSTLFDFEIPIRQRSTLFLEIFGNSLVQERTSRYISRTAKDLIETVTGGRGGGILGNIVDFSNMKYRERDSLQAIFKSWDHNNTDADVRDLRDHRLRYFYGERYDNRKSVLDWDYQTRVKEVASIIHIKQYREWRNSGVAYEFGDATYNVSNRTMVSYTTGMMKGGKDKGIKKDVRGFWLDIIVSPYPAFGVSVEPVNQFAKDLFYITNEGTGTEQHRHHAVEVATYNVMSYLWEMETKSKYEMKKKDDIFSGLGGDLSDAILKTEESKKSDAAAANEKDGQKRGETVNGNEQAESKKSALENSVKPKPPAPSEESEAEKLEKRERIRIRQAANRARNIVSTLKDVKIFPMSSIEENSVQKTLLSKSKFQNFFDHVFVSQHAVHHCGTEGFSNILKQGGTLRMETGKHIYALQRAQLQELVGKMGEMCNSHNDLQICNERCIGAKGELDYDAVKDLEVIELVKNVT